MEHLGCRVGSGTISLLIPAGRLYAPSRSGIVSRLGCARMDKHLNEEVFVLGLGGSPSDEEQALERLKEIHSCRHIY